MQAGADEELPVVLPPDPASAKRARDLITDRCQQWDVAELCSDLALVATELVANAIRHAGTEVVLRLLPVENGVRLEVGDGSTRPLQPRAADAEAEGGRGLLLVDALSTQYGVQADPLGKRVWVELHART